MRLEPLNRTTTGQWLVIAAVAIPVLQLNFPHLAYAQMAAELDEPTFEIKIQDVRFAELLEGTIMVALEEEEDLVTLTSQIDPLEVRKQKLHEYFTTIRPSRFANHVDTLAAQPHWRRVIAIAFVESTLGKRCYYDNCWGITYSSGLARFSSLDEGIQVHNDLIARRYADKTYEQMNCVYVVPCNPRWLRGVHQIEAELDQYVEPRLQ